MVSLDWSPPFSSHFHAVQGKVLSCVSSSNSHRLTLVEKNYTHTYRESACGSCTSANRNNVFASTTFNWIPNNAVLRICTFRDVPRRAGAPKSLPAVHPLLLVAAVKQTYQPYQQQQTPTAPHLEFQITALFKMFSRNISVVNFTGSFPFYFIQFLIFMAIHKPFKVLLL